MNARPILYVMNDDECRGVCLQFIAFDSNLWAIVETSEGGIRPILASNCWFVDVGGVDAAPVQWQIDRCRMLGAG
jgi:hypothetical protein